MAQGNPNQPEYIVGLNNNPRGPFNRDDLILFARGGLLNEKTRIFVKGWERWKTMGEVDELSTLLAEHPPSPASPPALALAPSAAALDGETRSALGAIQTALERLNTELARRTDQLGEGQKISIESVSGEQGEIKKLLTDLKSEVKALGQSGTQALAGELADLRDTQQRVLQEILGKSQRETTVLLDAMQSGLALKLQSLESLQKSLSDRWSEQQEARKKETEASQASFERLQQTLAAEKEKELLAFANRVEDMDRRFSALQQAFYLSVEQFKQDITTSLAGQGADAAQKQTEAIRAAEARHQALIEAQGETAAELARVRGLIGDRLQAQEQQRQMEQEKLLQTLASISQELESAPGRLDELSSRLLEEQQKQAGRNQTQLKETTQVLGGINQRLTASEKVLAELSEGQTKLTGKLEDSRQTAASQTQSLQIRLDAQLQTLLAAVESRGAVLAADMEQRGQAFNEAVAGLRAGIKEFEDITLERYHVLLAAADDQRVIPERVSQLMGEWSGEMKALVEKVSQGLATVQEHTQSQAERFYEELGSTHQEQIHRQQVADSERLEQFTLLSQALNRVVTHLEGDLPAHLARVEAQVEVGTKSLQSILDKNATELASELATRAKKADEKSHKLQAEILEGFRKVQEGLQASLADQQKQLGLFQDSHRGDLKEMSSLLLGATEKGIDSVNALAAQHLETRDTTLQSLTHLGGWAQSLHEKMEKGLTQSLAESAKAQAELRGLLANAQETSAKAVAAQEKALEQRHKDALQALNQIESRIPERIGAELRGVAELVEKSASEGQKRTSAELASVLSHLQTGHGALQKALAGEMAGAAVQNRETLQTFLSSELASAVGQITQTQQAMQKMLADEWTGVWSQRWAELSTVLSRLGEDASVRREQLAKRLGELEDSIPAAVAAQLKARSEEIGSGLKELSSALAQQEKRTTEAGREMEKLIAQHFTGHQRSVEQLFRSVQDDVSALRSSAPVQQKTLVEELHKAVSRLPDHLAESYRVTNNAMQKQLAEMAQDVSQATQHVEHSRSALEKVGSNHLSSLQEASESSRQQVAAVIREAKEERAQLHAQLLQELKTWQFEQKKILAAVLKGNKGQAQD
ncbi:MAG: GYF domain-containing protein [Candidatus Methylacidiphilales bacterium]|nr:GYF domain-containing protein [Candidatus Methylacidiphilales bacterium]